MALLQKLGVKRTTLLDKMRRHEFPAPKSDACFSRPDSSQN